MRVQKIMSENRNAYLLLDTNGKPIPPVAKYMKFLYNRECSSNTLKTYCTALKHYFTYLNEKKLSYKNISFEGLSNFIAWLRNPNSSTKIISYKNNKIKRSEKTVNNYLTVVTSFYDYLYRNGLIEANIVEKLMKNLFIGAGGKGYKGFFHHLDRKKVLTKNVLKLDEPKTRIKVYKKEEMSRIYHATTNTRDRFLVRLLLESGLRIGEVLSLFIEDFYFDSKKRKHKIILKDRGELPNGGKLKTGERTLDISQELMDLYDDYLYEIIDEYNPEHNFVFIKMRGENAGEPLTYSDVYASFKALEKKTDIHVTPHKFRHTHGTIYYLKTKSIKMVQERLGHAQIQTTINLYVHPSEDDIRMEWEKAASAFDFLSN